jgi:hypothetical protein
LSIVIIVGLIARRRPRPQSSTEVRQSRNTRLGDDHAPITLDDGRWRPGARFDHAGDMNQIVHPHLRFELFAVSAVTAQHQQVWHVAAVKAVEFDPSSMEDDVQAVARSPLGHHVTIDAPAEHCR